jgi:hypothetical protein
VLISESVARYWGQNAALEGGDHDEKGREEREIPAKNAAK